MQPARCDKWRDASAIGVTGHIYDYDADGNVVAKTINVAGNTLAGKVSWFHDSIEQRKP